jgi:hypothetical protein
MGTFSGFIQASQDRLDEDVPEGQKTDGVGQAGDRGHAEQGVGMTFSVVGLPAIAQYLVGHPFHDRP